MDSLVPPGHFFGREPENQEEDCAADNQDGCDSKYNAGMKGKTSSNGCYPFLGAATKKRQIS